MNSRSLLQYLTITMLAIFLAGEAAWAGSGTHAADFLNIPADSRGAALGNSCVSNSAGAGALFYNPAALAADGFGEMSFSHAELMQDLRLDNISLALPLKSGGLGVGITYLGYGDIQGYDVAGVATGDLSAYSMQVSIGYSQRLGEALSAGIAVKPVIEKLADYNANTVTFDAGLLAQFGRFSVGAQYANIGGSLKYLDESISLPATIRVGASFRTIGFSTFSMAAAKTEGESTVLGAGLEYQYSHMLAFRAGYNGALESSDNTADGLSLGAGLHLGQMGFDYSYRPTASQEGVHQITASLRFGR